MQEESDIVLPVVDMFANIDKSVDLVNEGRDLVLWSFIEDFKFFKLEMNVFLEVLPVGVLQIRVP